MNARVRVGIEVEVGVVNLSERVILLTDLSNLERVNPRRVFTLYSYQKDS